MRACDGRFRLIQPHLEEGGSLKLAVADAILSFSYRPEMVSQDRKQLATASSSAPVKFADYANDLNTTPKIDQSKIYDPGLLRSLCRSLAVRYGHFDLPRQSGVPVCHRERV